MGLINLPSMDDILQAKDTKSQMEMLVNTVGLLMKSLSELNGYINSKNVLEVGGWKVDQSALQSKDSDVGMSTADTPADDVRFWAGASVPEIAPFRVLESGKVYTNDLEAVDAKITGAEIIGATITGGTINVTTDLNVGSRITMQGTGLFDRQFWFDSTGFTSIRSYESSPSVKVIDLIAFGGVYANGNVIATQDWVTTQLAGKSDVGHTHSVTISSHNHGIPDPTNLATSGGGSVTHSSSGGGTYTTSS